jgi:hypothetical protein
LFYREICTSDTPIPIHEFLFGAWSKKETPPFYEILDYMTIPKNVQLFYPGLMSFIEKSGVEYIKVTIEFQGGVRDIRTIEDELRCAGLFYGDPNQSQIELPFDLILEKTQEICTSFSDDLYRKPSKKDTWLSGMDSEQKMNILKSLAIFDATYHGVQEI